MPKSKVQSKPIASVCQKQKQNNLTKSHTRTAPYKCNTKKSGNLNRHYPNEKSSTIELFSEKSKNSKTSIPDKTKMCVSDDITSEKCTKSRKTDSLTGPIAGSSKPTTSSTKPVVSNKKSRTKSMPMELDRKRGKKLSSKNDLKKSFRHLRSKTACVVLAKVTSSSKSPPNKALSKESSSKAPSSKSVSKEFSNKTPPSKSLSKESNSKTAPSKPLSKEYFIKSLPSKSLSNEYSSKMASSKALSKEFVSVSQRTLGGEITNGGQGRKVKGSYKTRSKFEVLDKTRSQSVPLATPRCSTVPQSQVNFKQKTDGKNKRKKRRRVSSVNSSDSGSGDRNQKDLNLKNKKRKHCVRQSMQVNKPCEVKGTDTMVLKEKGELDIKTKILPEAQVKSVDEEIAEMASHDHLKSVSTTLCKQPGKSPESEQTKVKQNYTNVKNHDPEKKHKVIFSGHCSDTGRNFQTMRKKLRSEVAKNELWEGLPNDIRIPRLPKCDREGHGATQSEKNQNILKEGQVGKTVSNTALPQANRQSQRTANPAIGGDLDQCGEVDVGHVTPDLTHYAKWEKSKGIEVQLTNSQSLGVPSEESRRKEINRSSINNKGKKAARILSSSSKIFTKFRAGDVVPTKLLNVKQNIQSNTTRDTSYHNEIGLHKYSHSFSKADEYQKITVPNERIEPVTSDKADISILKYDTDFKAEPKQAEPTNSDVSKYDRHRKGAIESTQRYISPKKEDLECDIRKDLSGSVVKQHDLIRNRKLRSYKQQVGVECGDRNNDAGKPDCGPVRKARKGQVINTSGHKAVSGNTIDGLDKRTDNMAASDAIKIKCQSGLSGNKIQINNTTVSEKMTSQRAMLHYKGVSSGGIMSPNRQESCLDEMSNGGKEKCHHIMSNDSNMSCENYASHDTKESILYEILDIDSKREEKSIPIDTKERNRNTTSKSKPTHGNYQATMSQHNKQPVSPGHCPPRNKMLSTHLDVLTDDVIGDEQITLKSKLRKEDVTGNANQKVVCSISGHNSTSATSYCDAKKRNITEESIMTVKKTSLDIYSSQQTIDERGKKGGIGLAIHAIRDLDFKSNEYVCLTSTLSSPNHSDCEHVMDLPLVTCGQVESISAAHNIKTTEVEETPAGGLPEDNMKHVQESSNLSANRNLPERGLHEQLQEKTALANEGSKTAHEHHSVTTINAISVQPTSLHRGLDGELLINHSTESCSTSPSVGLPSVTSGSSMGDESPVTPVTSLGGDEGKHSGHSISTRGIISRGVRRQVWLRVGNQCKDRLHLDASSNDTKKKVIPSAECGERKEHDRPQAEGGNMPYLTGEKVIQKPVSLRVIRMTPVKTTGGVVKNRAANQRQSKNNKGDNLGCMHSSDDKCLDERVILSDILSATSDQSLLHHSDDGITSIFTQSKLDKKELLVDSIEEENGQLTECSLVSADEYAESEQNKTCASKKINHFHQLEVVARGSETQLQVGKNCTNRTSGSLPTSVDGQTDRNSPQQMHNEGGSTCVTSTEKDHICSSEISDESGPMGENTKALKDMCCSNTALMPGQPQRRCATINTAIGERTMLAGTTEHDPPETIAGDEIAKTGLVFSGVDCLAESSAMSSCLDGLINNSANKSSTANNRTGDITRRSQIISITPCSANSDNSALPSANSGRRSRLISDLASPLTFVETKIVTNQEVVINSPEVVIDSSKYQEIDIDSKCQTGDDSRQTTMTLMTQAHAAGYREIETADTVDADTSLTVTADTSLTLTADTDNLVPDTASDSSESDNVLHGNTSYDEVTGDIITDEVLVENTSYDEVTGEVTGEVREVTGEVTGEVREVISEYDVTEPEGRDLWSELQSDLSRTSEYGSVLTRLKAKMPADTR